MKLVSSMTALLLGSGAAAAVGYAFGQGFLGFAPYSPTGTELVSVRPLTATGSQAPSDVIVPMNVISNRNDYLVIGSNTSAANTVTISTATDELMVNAQVASTSWILPSSLSAFDGEQFQFCNVSGAAFATNVQSIVAAGGTNINLGSTSQSSTSVTTLASQTCLELVYSSASKLWYRIR